MLEGSVVLFALPKQIHIGKHTDRQTEEGKPNHWKQWENERQRQANKKVRQSGAQIDVVKKTEKERDTGRHRWKRKTHRYTKTSRQTEIEKERHVSVDCVERQSHSSLSRLWNVLQ